MDGVAVEDAVFTSDTGMATVWLSRLVAMGGGRVLFGFCNLGSMAIAMPSGRLTRSAWAVTGGWWRCAGMAGWACSWAA